MNAIEVQRAAEVLRRRRGGPRDQLRRSAPARSSGCSDRTAPARRRRSRSSRATASRDGGEVERARRRPAARRPRWRERIGVVPQSGELYPNLTVAEHLELFAGYYAEPRAAERGARRSSGSRRSRREDADALRRPEAAARPRVALVGDPELLFLDEPTTGFDPGARRAAWETIRSLRSLGKTILLTTHYIEEAQRLADRVAVLRRGEIVAAGTPAELTAAAPASRIRYRRNGEEVVLETEEPTRVLHELTERGAARRLRARGARGAPPDARGRLPLAHRGAAGVRLLLHQLRAEQRLFWRSRELAFFTFLLPIIFFLILGSAYGDEEIDGVDGYLVPARRDDRLRRARRRPSPASRCCSSSAASRACSSASARRRCRPATYIAAVLGSIVFVFLLEAVDPARARPGRLRRRAPGQRCSRWSSPRARRRRLRGARRRPHGADPQRRRLVRRRERDLPAGVVHLRLVLLAGRLPGVLRAHRGGPAARST